MLVALQFCILLLHVYSYFINFVYSYFIEYTLVLILE
jgi:hypothetical protein